VSIIDSLPQKTRELMRAIYKSEGIRACAYDPVANANTMRTRLKQDGLLDEQIRVYSKEWELQPEGAVKGPEDHEAMTLFLSAKGKKLAAEYGW